MEFYCKLKNDSLQESKQKKTKHCRQKMHNNALFLVYFNNITTFIKITFSFLLLQEQRRSGLLPPLCLLLHRS